MTSHRLNHAFSLVELLVSIGVIGVLLSISAPALRQVRRSAGETRSLSNLSQIGRSIDMYLSANAQELPCMKDGIWYPWNAPGATGSIMQRDARWMTAHNWFCVLHAVSPWQQHLATWVSPGVDVEQRAEGGSFVPSYRYSHSFLASPRLWDPETHPSSVTSNSTSFLSIPRATHVAYPAAKVMMYDHEVAYVRLKQRYMGLPDMNTPMLFADSHAEARQPRDAVPPVRNVLHMDSFFDAPLYNTPHGVLGRDY
ncbi:MAG: type II secretion system protein [Phycisphaerales bacterium]